MAFLGKQTSTPTCYIFPVPEPPNLSLSATVFSPVPFVAFVSLEGGTSSGRGREPGFLLVTTWGQIVYWRSVSAALSGIHAHEEATLGLHPGEVVRATSALSVSIAVDQTCLFITYENDRIFPHSSRHATY